MIHIKSSVVGLIIAGNRELSSAFLPGALPRASAAPRPENAPPRRLDRRSRRLAHERRDPQAAHKKNPPVNTISDMR